MARSGGEDAHGGRLRPNHPHDEGRGEPALPCKDQMRDIFQQFHQMAEGPQGGLAEVFGRMWSVPVFGLREYNLVDAGRRACQTARTATVSGLVPGAPGAGGGPSGRSGRRRRTEDGWSRLASGVTWRQRKARNGQRHV